MSDVASIYANLRNAVANSQISDEDILQIAIKVSKKLYEQQRDADVARICSETGLEVDKFLPKLDQLNRKIDATNGISFDCSTFANLWASFKSAIYDWHRNTADLLMSWTEAPRKSPVLMCFLISFFTVYTCLDLLKIFNCYLDGESFVLSDLNIIRPLITYRYFIPVWLYFRFFACWSR
jgi:hypothetical protein